MSTVKVSDLPVVTHIDDPDFIIVNDDNLTTSGIEFSDFIGSLFARDITFEGEVTFKSPVAINNNLEINGELVVNLDAVFNGDVTFSKGFNATLYQLSDVSIDGSLTKGHTLVYDDITGKWNNEFMTFQNIYELDVIGARDGQILVYNSLKNKWVNADGQGGSGAGGALEFTDFNVFNEPVPYGGGKLEYDDFGTFTFTPANVSGSGGGGVGGIAYGPTPPSAATEGDFWVNSVTLKMYVYDDSWIQIRYV